MNFDKKTLKIIAAAAAGVLVLTLLIILVCCGGKDSGGSGNVGGDNGGSIGSPSTDENPTVSISKYYMRFISAENYNGGNFADESLANDFVPDPGKPFYVVIDLYCTKKALPENGSALTLKTTSSAADVELVLDLQNSSPVASTSSEQLSGGISYSALVSLKNDSQNPVRLIYAATAASRGEISLSSVVYLDDSAILEGENTVEKKLDVGAPDFTLSANDYGAYSISKVRKDITVLDIPEYYEGKRINGIMAGAFSSCTAITEIDIPEHILYVGAYAFRDCTSLKRVTVHDKLQMIEYGAFQGCTSLEYLSLPFLGKTADESGNKTLEYIFANGSGASDGEFVPDSLKTVVLKRGTKLAMRAFQNCSGICEIILPEELTEIGYSAFLGCSSLESIDLPEGVALIGESAFMNCTSLTAFTVPSKVKKIAERTFAGCTSLKEFVVPDTVEEMGYGIFLGCTSLEKLTLPFIGKSINTENYLLYIFGSQVAAQTEFPASMKTLIVTGGTQITKETFKKCPSLVSITLPETITTIAEGAFAHCTVLAEVNVGDGCEKYSSVNGVLYTKDYQGRTILYLYPSAKEDKTFVMPQGISEISANAFEGNKHLEEISFGTNESFDRIGNNAFLGCTALKVFDIDSLLTLTSIGYDAFDGCTALGKVYAKDLLAWCSISFSSQLSSPLCTGAELYINGKLAENIVILERIDSIKDHAFYNCKTLKSIAIGSSFTSIGSYAFEGCENLVNVNLSDNITSIGNFAFLGCTSMVLTALPKSLRTIGWYSFSGCTSITSLTVPSGITSIGNNAFEGCVNIESVNISDLSAWCKINFATEESNPLGDKSTLYVNGEALTSFTVPSTVTSISAWSFAGYTKLDYLEVHSAVTGIGLGAFSGTSIASVKLPFVGASADVNSNSYLGYIFGSLTSVPSTLKTVEITGTVAVPSGAFSGVTSLTDVVIGDSVSAVGEYAFSGCTSLVRVTVGSGVSSIGIGAFSGCTSLNTLTVPFVGKNASSATRIGYFFGDEYSPIPESLKSVTVTKASAIGESAFSGCSSIETVTLSEGLLSIGGRAFADCTSIREICIPASVTSISGAAFSGCSALTSITVDPENTSYVTVAGNLYNKQGTALCAYACGKADTAFILPAGVETVGRYAFSGANNLKSIDLTNGSLIYVRTNAITKCLALETLVIPGTVSEIGADAISGCDSLSTLTIPHVGISTTSNNANEKSFGYIFGAYKYEDNPTYVPSSLKTLIITGSYSVDYNAFYGCDMLEYITLPKTMGTSIVYALDECSGLLSITVDPENRNLASIDGNLYSKDGKTFYRYAPAKTDTTFTLPETVTVVEVFAFAEAASLKSITIPSGATVIGKAAFRGCTSLESISLPWVGDSMSNLNGFVYYFGDITSEIPESIREITVTGTAPIKDRAFENLTSLVKVTVAGTVPSIGAYAFSACTSLTEVVLSSGIASIGKYAFTDCTSLTKIVIPATVATVGEGAFYRANESLVIRCEAASLPSGWNSLWNAGFLAVEWNYTENE